MVHITKELWSISVGSLVAGTKRIHVFFLFAVRSLCFVAAKVLRAAYFTEHAYRPHGGLGSRAGQASGTQQRQNKQQRRSYSMLKKEIIPWQAALLPCTRKNPGSEEAGTHYLNCASQAKNNF